MNKTFKFIICIAIPLVVGFLSGIISAPKIQTWYLTLQKPSFDPPNYIFGPVWTTLYILMGVSLFMIVRSESDLKARALIIFSVQLLLNFFWSIIFFNLERVGLALIEIGLLWICILLMINTFYKISKRAAYLQIPYLLWVSFATILNTAIFNLN
jgi:benzodiazapine receptor